MNLSFLLFFFFKSLLFAICKFCLPCKMGYIQEFILITIVSYICEGYSTLLKTILCIYNLFSHSFSFFYEIRHWRCSSSSTRQNTGAHVKDGNQHVFGVSLITFHIVFIYGNTYSQILSYNWIQFLFRLSNLYSRSKFLISLKVAISCFTKLLWRVADFIGLDKCV